MLQIIKEVVSGIKKFLNKHLRGKKEQSTYEKELSIARKSLKTTS